MKGRTNLAVAEANRARKGKIRYRKPPQYVEEDRGYTTPCWAWQLMTNEQGYAYGRMRGRGQMGRMHKLYWEALHGPVPEGHHLHHLCEQVDCVNPAHLEVVTAAVHRRLHPH